MSLHPKLVSLLACPVCSGEIRQQEPTELVCLSCGQRYPIVDDIPQMLPHIVSSAATRVADRFADQWKTYCEWVPAYREQFLGWLDPVPGDFLAGKVVLDAGCGKGRHLVVSSDFDVDLVVGMDLGGAVEVARQHTLDRPNVAWVQGDIFHPPFRRECFDYVYTIGVLHHTPDPGAAFSYLLPLIRPGGHISAWVYGYENNGWLRHIVDPLRRHVTGRLPPPILRQLSHWLSWILYGAVRLLYRPSSMRALPLPYKDYLVSVSGFPRHELESIIFDHLHPEFNAYIPRKEFETWFTHLEEVVIRWHNKNSWAGFARKPKLPSSP